jgi:hypothetical protein
VTPVLPESRHSVRRRKEPADCQKQNFPRGRCGPNMRSGAESKPRRRNPSTAVPYSAAAGDTTLGEIAEWDPDPTFAELFAPAALISSSGLSERRDFPSK